MIKSALITGITGQDGSHLAELLLANGYRVIGTTRDILRARQLLPKTVTDTVTLAEWDLRDQSRIEELLAGFKPAEIYNFGAHSSGAGMFDDPLGIGDINGLAVTRILEAIRTVDKSTRFCQASSSEMFGEPCESPQSESTPFKPRTPYGAAKLYAHSLVRIYRQNYGLFACSAILFNHEGPRRGQEFVTRKVTHAAARIKLGLSDKLHLGDLDARRDWGFAADYVRAMWLMLQATIAEDYVIATGKTHSVRELCECAFGHVGLDYRAFVSEDGTARRRTEALVLVGNADKAKRDLNWDAEVGFDELVRMMVDADLQMLGEQIGI